MNMLRDTVVSFKSQNGKGLRISLIFHTSKYSAGSTIQYSLLR